MVFLLSAGYVRFGVYEKVKNERILFIVRKKVQFLVEFHLLVDFLNDKYASDIPATAKAALLYLGEQTLTDINWLTV